MIKKENREEECYWYWSTPAEGLSIEDSERIVQQSLQENKNQETEKRFGFAVFT